MSTKTTFKRVALVAVVALGLGGLSAVPATAAAGTGSTISSIAVGTVPTARVGETVTVPVTINTAAAMAASETIVVAAKITSAPSVNGGQTATSALSSASSTSTQVSGNVKFWISSSASGNMPAAVVIGARTASTNRTTSPTAGTVYIGSASSTAGDLAAGGAGITPAAALSVATAAADSSETVYVSFIPDVAGSYSFIVSATSWAGTGTDTSHMSYVAGDISGVATVATGGAPTTVTLTKINSSHPKTSTGSLIRVNLNGQLTGDEAVDVTASSGAYIAEATVSAGTFTSGTPTASTSARLTSADFVNGIAFVNVLGTTAGSTYTVTATGTGTLAAITTNTTVTTGYASTAAAAAFVGADGTAVTTGWKAGTSPAYTIKSTATSSSIEVTYTDPGTTDDYLGVNIVDFGGKIVGAPNTSNGGLKFTLYSGALVDDSTYTTFSLTHTALGTSAYNVAGYTIEDATTTWQVQGGTSVGTTITPTPSNVRGTTGGSVTIKALVTDQFGLAVASSSTTVTVAGRNSARTSETLITDATGYVTTTITDAGTTTAADTVTFTNTTTGTATITWGTYTVGTVTVTGGKTASDSYAGQNLTSISTAKAGPDGSSKAIAATVKDSDGVVLAGVPVTFTVSKGLVRKTASTDYTTVYTNANGVATTYVIDWTEGTQTITATAGGKSASDYLTWDQNVAASARSVAGAASGNQVIATVKDRYGNTVYGVTVNAKTSIGYFGSGSNSTTCVTDYDGTCSLFVSGVTGEAVVTLSLAKGTYTESIDLAGFVNEVAVTAAIAGTTVGTGASLSAAGVNSVTVAVSAVDAAASSAAAAGDAAAEATDAANAATDAANAAAEAADAATAAAQDAADAVAALSAQVASLISGLKAQLTALTNLVIKIQKKVKA